MSSLQLDVSAGSLVFSWTESGLISGIRWTRLDPEETESRDGLLLSGKVGLSQIPTVVVDLVERFRDYFETGSPLGSIPWEQIDQTPWSEFQTKVFRAIAMIPHGETRSYIWLAERIRNFRACRAVGQALRTNPFPVLIPCHRIISKKGALGGFMGKSDPTDPELILKKRLIEIEESFVSPPFPFFGLQAS